VGLKLRDPREETVPGENAALFSVPGSHDIWGRGQPKVMNAYNRHFPGKFPIMKFRTTGRPIVLHGLDSTENTKWLARLARGRVSHEQLDFVCEWISAAKRDESDPVNIVCMHHPLSDPPGKEFNLTMRLDERDAIAKRLAKSGADLVLAGHVHEYYCADPKVGDSPGLVVAGSSTQQLSARSFYVLDVYDTEIRVEVFEYTDSLQFCAIKDFHQRFAISKRTPSGLSVGTRRRGRPDGRGWFSG
jgi:3',5'-cyclic AMP phosphodiesterase CpdA